MYAFPNCLTTQGSGSGHYCYSFVQCSECILNVSTVLCVAITLQYYTCIPSGCLCSTRYSSIETSCFVGSDGSLMSPLPRNCHVYLVNVLLRPGTSFCALGSPFGASDIPEKGAKAALFFFLSFFFFLPSPSSACSTDLAFA